MWSDPLEIENNHHKEKFHTFFIDTEGLGAYDEEINHDSKIFLVAILISSLFILNSFGNIDENSINALSFILNISKTIKLHQNNYDANNNPEEISVYFPSLLWLLRDFSLKLEDSQGNTITAKQYLENALQLQKGFSETVEEKNKVRKLITSYFKERDCFSMVRPVENEKDLQNLQTLEDEQIRKEFLEQAETLRNKVFKKVKPKNFNNKILSGSMLIELLDNILDSINNGAVPVIENSWKYMLYNESLKHMKIILEKLKIKIFEFKEFNKDNQKFLKEFERFQHDSQKTLIEEFLKDAISPESSETQECLLKLKTKFNEEFKKIYEEHSKVFENQLNEFFEINTKSLYQDFETDKYYRNHYIFFRDLDDLKENAENTIPDFQNKKELLYHNVLIIIKKLIEQVYLKYKNLNEQEISNLKGENAVLLNKYTFKNDEYEKSKSESTNNITRLNNQILDLKLKERSLEDKLNQVITEKRNMFSANQEAVSSIKTEYNSKLEKLRIEIENYKQDIKTKDDQILKMKFSEEKLTALNNQKIEFLEKDNVSYKERCDILSKENEKLKDLTDEQYLKIDNLNSELLKRKANENVINKKNNNSPNLNNKQKTPRERYNSGPVCGLVSNFKDLDNDKEQEHLNYEIKDINYFNPIEHRRNTIANCNLNINNNNLITEANTNMWNNNTSMNNSCFAALGINSDFLIQQNNKIIEYLKEVKSEQIYENKKLLSEFKEEILREVNKYLKQDKSDLILEDNRVRI